MYTLYYSPGACSLAVHALLYALAVPFQTVRIDITKGEQHAPEFLKLNPRGQVPVLTLGDQIMRESGAMTLFLAGRHVSDFWPQDDAGKAKATEWLFFYNSTLQQAYNAYFLLSGRLKEQKAREAACTLAVKRISYLWREVESHIAEHEYICGASPTAVDFFHAVIANWTTTLAPMPELGVNIRRLCAKVAAMDAFARALDAEKLAYALK